MPYYSCENANKPHVFKNITLEWKGVTYNDISYCTECASIYNLGFNVEQQKDVMKQIAGMDLSSLRMKEPTAVSQRAFAASNYEKILPITKEQQTMWDKMLGQMREEIAEMRKHKHAYPIWRVFN